MILLKRGTESEIIVTLTDKASLSEPNYLFVFKHQTTLQEKAFVLPDLSTHPKRYNQFKVDTGGFFSDVNDGLLYYTVYEQTTTENTEAEQAGAIVETGIAKLISSSSEPVSQYTNENHRYIAYDGRN